MNDNAIAIRMHLEYYLWTETKQAGNISLWALLSYCLGYYGEINNDILTAVRSMDGEGWYMK